MAQSARSNPVTANASGITSTAPVSWRSGSWWCNDVVSAVASSSRVNSAVSGSPNHCSAPRR